MLSVAVAPGGHPLRALASADGAAPPFPPAWAEVSRAADPVAARSFAVLAIAVDGLVPADRHRPSSRFRAHNPAYSRLQWAVEPPDAAQDPCILFVMICCGKHFTGLCTDDSAARGQVLTSNNHGGAAENNVSLIETGSDARLFSVRRAPPRDG